MDPYERGVLARGRPPGDATSCAKPARRRRDFWVKLPRARRARSTERRANGGARRRARRPRPPYQRIVLGSRRRRQIYMLTSQFQRDREQAVS